MHGSANRRPFLARYTARRIMLWSKGEINHLSLATVVTANRLIPRMGRFKIVLAEQRSTGLAAWREPLATMRVPKFFDLRADPFERGEESDSLSIKCTSNL
jgi:hypothetical protein